MKFHKSILAGAAAAALLAACGGGGDAPAVVAPAPGPVPTISEVPLVTVSPPATYASGTPLANAYGHLNRARTECGFGALTQDVRLDRMADSHAQYLTIDPSASHNEPNPANPWFTGADPDVRASFVGYRNAAGTDATIGEGIAYPVGVVGSPGHYASLEVYGLLNAPYHAMDLLAPWQHVGIGISARTIVSPFGNSTAENLVLNYGSRNTTAGLLSVQTLPADTVLTWPCAATTGPVYDSFRGENPPPVPGRNLATQPVGTPFYVVARKGSGLRVTSANLIALASGRSVPLMAARYSDSEVFPGTTTRFSSYALMDWAFILPDEKMPAGRYRMTFTASVNGKAVNRSVEFTTRDGLVGWDERDERR